MRCSGLWRRLFPRSLRIRGWGLLRLLGLRLRSDMMNCKVFVSIIGDRHVARQSMDALKNAAGFIRGELGDAGQAAAYAGAYVC